MATIPASSAKEDTRAGRTCRLNTLSAVQMTAILIRLRTTRARGARRPGAGRRAAGRRDPRSSGRHRRDRSWCAAWPGRLPETSPKRLAFEQAGERVRKEFAGSRGSTRRPCTPSSTTSGRPPTRGRDHRLPAPMYSMTEGACLRSRAADRHVRGDEHVRDVTSGPQQEHAVGKAQLLDERLEAPALSPVAGDEDAKLRLATAHQGGRFDGTSTAFSGRSWHTVTTTGRPRVRSSPGRHGLWARERRPRSE